MRKLLGPALFVVVIALVVGAYIQGRNDVLIAEMKTYEGNLVTFELLQPDKPAELREFMKARYYFLVNRVPKSWRATHDFGPVSTNIAHLTIGKGPTTAKLEYETFKANLRVTH
jgi:hypothetical protein